MGQAVRLVSCAYVLATPLCLLANNALAEVAAAPDASPETTAASDQLQEIVVTALKTGAQQLQRIPESLSVVSGDQLTNGVINNIGALADQIPNLSFNRNLAYAEIYIRGIGSSNIAAGSDPDVTTQIDGVYIARASGQLTDFLDVDRIEVLRGPQGTLYGRNAVGGTINIVSRQPSDTFTGETVLSGGNFGYAEVQGYLSGPLAETLQGSLAYDWGYHDPYFKNIAPGGHDVGNDDHRGVRGQLRWEPASSVDATTRVDFSYQNQAMPGGDPLSRTFSPLANTIIGDLDKVDLNLTPYLYSQNDGISEEVNWHFAPNFNLKSISAYRMNDAHFVNDNDGTEFNAVDFNSGESDKAVSQELNLQYNDERLSGVAGLYYFHDQDISTNSVNVYVPFPPAPHPAIEENIAGVTTVYSNSSAIFAQGTYSITPEFSAVLGGRYTYERKTLDQTPGGGNTILATGLRIPSGLSAFGLSGDFSAFTPKFGLNWQVTSDTLLYVSATRGYKSGGFNYTATSPADAEFSPEKIWSYEAGAKTEWLDHRLRLNIDGFYYRYTDLQVQQLLGFGIATITNAATAQGRGAEVELVAKPATSLKLTVNFAALDARYINYPNASVPQGVVGLVPGETCIPSPTGGPPSCEDNASGHYLTNAPTTSAFGAVDYTHDLLGGFRVTAHLDYNWHSRTYFDPSNIMTLSQGKYGLLNGQLLLALPNNAWRVGLFGRNLTNNVYAVQRTAPGLWPQALPGDPRTYGAQISYNW